MGSGESDNSEGSRVNDAIEVDQATINLTIAPQITALTITDTPKPNVIVQPTTVNVSVLDEVTQITVSELGAQGPQGVPGVTQTIFYTHHQGTPSAIWHIPHFLNGYPVATILDSSGQQVEGSVVFTDVNNLIYTFSAAFAGTDNLV